MEGWEKMEEITVSKKVPITQIKNRKLRKLYTLFDNLFADSGRRNGVFVWVKRDLSVKVGNLIMNEYTLYWECDSVEDIGLFTNILRLPFFMSEMDKELCNHGQVNMPTVTIQELNDPLERLVIEVDGIWAPTARSVFNAQ